MKSRFPERSKRILMIANLRSPLTQERANVGMRGGYQIDCYPHLDKNEEQKQAVLPSERNLFTGLSFLWSPLLLESFIHRIQPDLIHVHYAYQGLNNLVLSRLRPLVVTVMGGDILPEQGFYGLRRPLVRKILDAADTITSKSQFLDDALHRIGPYTAKICRATWGVDTKKFFPGLNVTPLRQKWNIHPEDLVFLSPRICQPFYNQPLIIEGFAACLNKFVPSVRAKLIVSEWGCEKSYRQSLNNLVERLNLTEHVRFVGEIPHSEMPRYYSLSEIMVAIPSSDGMPQSLYEAMACGTYPILGNLPSYRELIQDGVNGRTVEVGNVEALGSSMHWAATHPEKRETAAFINRQRILKVADKEEQDRIILSIYERLLKKYSFSE